MSNAKSITESFEPLSVTFINTANEAVQCMTDFNQRFSPEETVEILQKLYLFAIDGGLSDEDNRINSNFFFFIESAQKCLHASQFIVRNTVLKM